MLPRIIAAAGLMTALGLAPATAAEPLYSELQVTFDYGGSQQQLTVGVVPLLPGNACYRWWLQFPQGTVLTSVEERLILPEPLADWGDLATNPDDGVEISADNKVATSTVAPALDAEGWISKAWCAAAGDPLGQHSIEVAVDGTLTRTFDFVVVAPEVYTWPAMPQRDPRERSVVDSW